jgi:hypothetical protein
MDREGAVFSAEKMIYVRAKRALTLMFCMTELERQQSKQIE